MPMICEEPKEAPIEVVYCTFTDQPLSFVDRPLKQRVFTQPNPPAFAYDFETPRWVFEDGEPDDFTTIFLLPKGKMRLIAEPHHKRGAVVERTKQLLQTLGEDENVVVPGGAIESEVDRLIEHLKALPDHSLSIQIIAPCPTLSAIIQKNPELLAQKIKRMVSYGGFVHQACEHGKLAGQKVYYTTFNLTVDLEASQTLFSFAQTYHVPFYILAGDNLRVSKSIYFDLPYKIRSMDIPATQYIAKEIEAWNAVSLKGKLLETLKKEAVIAGYNPEDIFSLEMTPADTIATVLDLAFDQLEITSRGFSNIRITDEPRYDKEGSTYLPKSYRAVMLEEDPNSSIRYVDGFRFPYTNLTTSETFEIVLNHLLNIRWSEYNNLSN